MAEAVKNHGYNLAFEASQCFAKRLDQVDEVELHKMIDVLKLNNIQASIIGDLQNKMAHGKKNKGIDLQQDEEARKLAYLVHLRNHSIFGEGDKKKIQGIDGDKQIEELLQGAISELRACGYSDDKITAHAVLERIQVPSQVKIDPLDESDIDVVIQGLDAENKMVAADINQQMMKINTKYDDRSHLIEIARQVLKEADELIKSILHKTTGR